MAARYRPATGNLFVGGDWYDVIRLAEGRRALVVGDCVGKGLEADTVMGQLRSVLAAQLLEGSSPAAASGLVASQAAGSPARIARLPASVATEGMKLPGKTCRLMKSTEASACR